MGPGYCITGEVLWDQSQVAKTTGFKQVVVQMGMLLSCEHKAEAMKDAIKQGLEQRLEQASLWIREKEELIQLEQKKIKLLEETNLKLEQEKVKAVEAQEKAEKVNTVEKGIDT